MRHPALNRAAAHPTRLWKLIKPRLRSDRWIACRALPGSTSTRPTCHAAELAEAGDFQGARKLLMDVLCTELRCIDAHAHLGNWEFERSPKRAMSADIGIRIAELSLSPGFDGPLMWGHTHNRPFLRCLHGYGLCLWRLGEHSAAIRCSSAYCPSIRTTIRA